MRKVNIRDVEELTWTSPRGKFRGAGKQISEALGRKPESTDVNERHPLDVEMLRLEPGTTPYPFHSHSAQLEYYSPERRLIRSEPLDYFDGEE